MTTALLALRAAIRARCAADGSLAALLDGSAAILDEPPRGAAPAYCVFGPAEARDNSTSTDRGHLHRLALTVWARPGSAASGLSAAGRIAELLDDAVLTPSGHRLVRLSVEEIASDRDRDTNLAFATVRLTAATEVVG